MTETRDTTAIPERDRTPARRPGVGPRFLAWLRALPGRISLFYRQVVAELRKVIWPTRKELVTYTSVVIAFVVMVMAFVSVLDLAFGQAVLKVFG